MATIVTSTQTWQDRVSAKQKESRDAIPQAWMLPTAITDSLKLPLDSNPNRLIELDIVRRSGVLTDKELEITEKYTVEELLSRLASGQLTSLEVTIAFSKRAAIAQQLVSCLTEVFFDEAQQRAKQLDELRAQGKVIGPLHGLPVSVKDSFKIIGHDASVGYTAFLGNKATQNATLVNLLLDQGAVLYVKTNVPQTMMTADSENNIFGRTLNPWNTTLTAGGSSGGEGALVAFRGSPLGVGTDLAGSVRIPAVCCGTYGFKPTVGRVPFGGQASSIKPGMRFILPCAGPLANDVSALQTFVKTVIEAEPYKYDADVFDLPWRATNRISGKPSLRIGLLREDPQLPCLPPIRRALDEAASSLQAAGHTVVPLDPKNCHVGDATEVAWVMFGLDTTARNPLEQIGEPFIKSLTSIIENASTFNYTYTADVAGITERLDKVAALNVKRDSVADSWRQIWTSLDLDVVISPATQNVALPHDTFGLPPYTAMLNLLDYPACVIPFQKARPDLDSEAVTMQSGQHGPAYDPASAAGAPCHIQVFANRMHDEECLEAAKIIDACLKKT